MSCSNTNSFAYGNCSTFAVADESQPSTCQFVMQLGPPYHKSWRDPISANTKRRSIAARRTHGRYLTSTFRAPERRLAPRPNEEAMIANSTCGVLRVAPKPDKEQMTPTRLGPPTPPLSAMMLYQAFQASKTAMRFDDARTTGKRRRRIRHQNTSAQPTAQDVSLSSLTLDEGVPLDLESPLAQARRTPSSGSGPSQNESHYGDDEDEDEHEDAARTCASAETFRPPTSFACRICTDYYDDLPLSEKTEKYLDSIGRQNVSFLCPKASCHHAFTDKWARNILHPDWTRVLQSWSRCGTENCTSKDGCRLGVYFSEMGPRDSSVEDVEE